MNASTVATLIGGAVAAATAAQPVLNGVQGSLHTQDYFSLSTAVVMALFGWFTKMKGKE